MTAVPRAGRPAKPARSIRWLQRPSAAQPGLIAIHQNEEQSLYLAHEIPSDIGGRGFVLRKLVPEGDPYHVRIGHPRECSCECLGFLRWGHCKHIEGLVALLKTK